MVSSRCIMMVKHELKKLGLNFISVDLGVVEIAKDISETTRRKFETNLKTSGLELLDDKNSILVDSIKETVTKMIYSYDDNPKLNCPKFISKELGYDYTYLANVFSEVKGITIQQFIIQNKIERVKELLLYEKMTLTEISYLLKYSSVAHLSNQFKKVTGLTPTYFNKIKHKRKEALTYMQ